MMSTVTLKKKVSQVSWRKEIKQVIFWSFKFHTFSSIWHLNSCSVEFTPSQTRNLSFTLTVEGLDAFIIHTVPQTPKKCMFHPHFQIQISTYLKSQTLHHPPCVTSHPHMRSSKQRSMTNNIFISLRFI